MNRDEAAAAKAREFRITHLNPEGFAGPNGDQLEQLLQVAIGEAIDAVINTPSVIGFEGSVRREKAHQVERWGEASDRFKSDADWFWLVGWLAGKALAAEENDELRSHHIISSAAALSCWWDARERQR